MEIETERKQEKERRGVGWFNPAHENALRDPNKRREWTRKRNGKQKTKTKKKRGKQEKERNIAYVYGHTDNITIYTTVCIHIYINRYIPALLPRRRQWADVTPYLIMWRAAANHQIPPSTFFLSLFFRSTFLYDRGAYLTIKPSWSLINKRRPSM